MKKKIEIVEKMEMDGSHFIVLYVDGSYLVGEPIRNSSGYIMQDRQTALDKIEDYVKNLKTAKTIILKTEEIEIN